MAETARTNMDRSGWPLRLKTSGLIFLTATFPFLIPLVPSTDSQPTFSLFALLFAAAALAQCFNRDVFIRRDGFFLASAVFGCGLIWLCLSVIVNGLAIDNINRIVSFIMFQIALATGLLNHRLFTKERVLTALKAYLVFTVIFFLSRGKIESLIIQSRGEAITMLLNKGRGASTLSPEPSFFAFQIFTLFLLARLTVWEKMTARQKHTVQLITIGLLVASLGGYGLIYAAMVIFLSGRRYIFGSAILGGCALLAVASFFDISSLRFVKLFTSISSNIASSNWELKDVSILVRLTSFQEYLNIFKEHPFLGDGFRFYGGGGLVSLLASLGFYGLMLILTAVTAVIFLDTGLRLKLVLLAWLAFQFISGPIGLPFVGLLVGVILWRSHFGQLLSAINLLVRARKATLTQTSP